MIPIARVVIRFILRLLFRAELRGYARPTGKTLIVANHQSFIDGLLLGAFLPFAPTYLVHSQIAAKWHFKIFRDRGLVTDFEIGSTAKCILTI